MFNTREILENKLLPRVWEDKDEIQDDLEFNLGVKVTYAWSDRIEIEEDGKEYILFLNYIDGEWVVWEIAEK